MKQIFALCCLLALCACAASSAVTPAQVAADLTGIVKTLQTVEPLIIKAAPNALSPVQQAAIAQDLTLARTLLTQLAAGMPATTGASIANQIDGYINDAAGTLAAVAPAIPVLAPYTPAIDAIDAVLPEVEAFVNQYLPATMTTAARKRALPAPMMSADAGRQYLGIPIVHP